MLKNNQIKKEGNEMTRVEGTVYKLDKVMQIEGFRGFIVKTGNDPRPSKKKANLGMRRIISTCYYPLYLVLAGEQEINIYPLDDDENDIRSLLQDKGYKVTLKADYRKYQGAWKQAIGMGFDYGIGGVFTENGYAVREKLWADCWEHSLEMKFVRPGMLNIEGHDIQEIRIELVLTDVYDKGRELIIKALSKPNSMTGKQLVGYLKDSGLEDVITAVRYYEPD